MPNIIYYSRPIHRCPQNTHGTCHVSTNVSWSWLTLKSKKSKNRTCLIWLPPPPASGVTRDHRDMSHTPGQILQLKKREGPPVIVGIITLLLGATSFTTTNVKLRKPLPDLHLTFPWPLPNSWQFTKTLPDLHLTPWPWSYVPLTHT